MKFFFLLLLLLSVLIVVSYIFCAVTDKKCKYKHYKIFHPIFLFLSCMVTLIGGILSTLLLLGLLDGGTIVMPNELSQIRREEYQRGKIDGVKQNYDILTDTLYRKHKD